jgi:hypothetical protein
VHAVSATPDPTQSESRFADRPRDSIFEWPKITRDEASEQVSVTLTLGDWRNLLVIAGGEYGSEPAHLGREAVIEITKRAGFAKSKGPHRHEWILVPPGDDYCEGCGAYR